MKISNAIAALMFVMFPLYAQTQPVEPPSKPAVDVQVEDFKLKIELHGAGKNATGTADLVVRNGIGYQFLSESDSYISIIDWKKGTVTLLDLDRRVKTYVTSKQLDQFLGELYEDSDRIVSAEEKSKLRRARVSAEISRPLIDPRFEEKYDEKTHTLTLKNSSVTVEMKGEAETIEGRREAYASCLIAVTEIGAMRDPELLPPFTRLEAFKMMMVKYKLRPVEVTFIYRLAGPPQKMRLTYELVNKLSERETEAIARIIKLNKLTKEVSWADFEGDSEE